MARRFRRPGNEAMKLRIYLDTSIFSAYYDDRSPDRQTQTAEFWERVTAYDASTSELAREELEKTPNADRRRQLVKLLDGLTLHRVTANMRRLAEQYVTLSMLRLRSLHGKIYWCPGTLGISLIVSGERKLTRSTFPWEFQRLRLSHRRRFRGVVR